MGDQVVSYAIDYSAPQGKINRDLDSMLAKLRQVQGEIQKTSGMMKAMGQNTPGLVAFAGNLTRASAGMRANAATAAALQAALASVGKGNSSITGLTTRLQSLQAQLAAVAAQAGQAQAGLAGVGAGGGGGGGGSGGKAGGGGFGAGAKGFLMRTAAGVASHVAYAAFRNTVRQVGDTAADRRQFFAGATDVASGYRKDLQELAVLQGKTSADDDVIKADLDFQKKTLLNPEDSGTFRLEFGGAIAPSLKARGADGQPNITPEVAKGLEVEAGRFTARYGLDATTGGRMAGLLGVTHKVPSVAAGVGIMEQTMGQLNVEGVGPVKGMASHLLTLSGSMIEEGGGGRFKDYPQMAARFAASTVNQAGSAARAKTRIVQSDRLLRKTDNELLRKAGITQDDDYETAIRKLEPLIKGPRGDDVLKEAGFANSTERIAVIEEAKMNSIVDKQLADMPSPEAAKAQATARNAEYADTVPGRQQAAENAEFAATVRAGMSGEPLKAARASARARMIGSGAMKANGAVEGMMDMGRSLFGSLGGISGEDMRVDFEAVDELRREGRKVGVDVDKEFPGLAIKGPLAATDEAAFEASFGQAAGRIDALKNLKKGAALIGGAADQMMRDGQGQGQGGGRGGPPPPPVGNGGAGTTPMRR